MLEGISPELIATLKDQVIITLVKSIIGEGELRIPICELNDTYRDKLDMEVDQEAGEFVFTLRKKN